MAGLTLEIPPEAILALKCPPDRAQQVLREEFAVFLVREGLLPRPQARLVARMERLEFDDLLVRRKVPMDMGIMEFMEGCEIAGRLIAKSM